MTNLSTKKNILAIIGSAGSNASNHKLVEHIRSLTADEFNFNTWSDLKVLPHFDPAVSNGNPPAIILKLRKEIEEAAGIIISTPEYVFSIPAGLKNAIEWCVATTVFAGKPLGIITASAGGKQGHEQLQLIMKTVMTVFNADTTLLIPGIKGKINEEGIITDKKTKEALNGFLNAYRILLTEH